jgi:hypothetical protein
MRHCFDDRCELEWGHEGDHAATIKAKSLADAVRETARLGRPDAVMVERIRFADGSVTDEVPAVDMAKFVAWIAELEEKRGGKKIDLDIWLPDLLDDFVDQQAAEAEAAEAEDDTDDV